MLIIFSVFTFLIGLIIGSFLNCLIWRLYKEESIGGRSYCPSCRHQISWHDNIPLLSFIFLKGRCRHCHKKISWQYPLVELTSAVLFLWGFLNSLEAVDFSLSLARNWLLIITLIIIFVYDLRWQLIPMVVVWPMCLIFFFISIFLGTPWFVVGAAGLLSTAFFLIQYLITKRKGLGEGDIWLGLLLGFSFPSFSQLLLILVVAYSFGALVGIFLMVFKKESRKTKIALGPFLSFGAIIALIWGKE